MKVRHGWFAFMLAMTAVYAIALAHHVEWWVSFAVYMLMGVGVYLAFDNRPDDEIVRLAREIRELRDEINELKNRGE